MYYLDDVCTDGCLDSNYDQTIEFYDKRRLDLKNKEPNKAHIMIHELKQKYPRDITVITQNVDNLFEKAGSKEIVHLHGFLTQIYCMDEKCDFKEDIGYSPLKSKYDKCPLCNAKLRPDIVFFYEPAPMYGKLTKEIDDCEFLVIIGTSGNVINTDWFLNPKIEYSILNNLEPSDAINDKLYSKVLYKKATLAIDEIVQDIENFLGK